MVEAPKPVSKWSTLIWHIWLKYETSSGQKTNMKIKLTTVIDLETKQMHVNKLDNIVITYYNNKTVEKEEVETEPKLYPVRKNMLP